MAANSLTVFDPRRAPQRLRTALASIQGCGMGVVAEDRRCRHHMRCWGVIDGTGDCLTIRLAQVLQCGRRSVDLREKDVALDDAIGMVGRLIEIDANRDHHVRQVVPLLTSIDGHGRAVVQLCERELTGREPEGAA